MLSLKYFLTQRRKGAEILNIMPFAPALSVLLFNFMPSSAS